MNNEHKKSLVQCPNCGAQVGWQTDNSFRPFCSQRCSDDDFCKWANEEHKLVDDENYSDVMSEDLPPFSDTDQ